MDCAENKTDGLLCNMVMKRKGLAHLTLKKGSTSVYYLKGVLDVLILSPR